MKNQYVLIGAILLLLIGGFCGYKLKQCPAITNTVIDIDTVYVDHPIIDTNIKSRPKNVVKSRSKSFVSEVPKPTDHPIAKTPDPELPECTEWEQTDRLEYKGLIIDISDKGNCAGVFERNTNFSGVVTIPVITKSSTNNASIPPPFLSLYAGASASFSNRWKAFDVGPAVGVSIRKRHNFDYSYGVNTSTHIITLKTQIR